MAIKTTNAVAPFDQKYYKNVLLDRALPGLVYEQCGDIAPLPKGNGKTATFRRFESFSDATTALTEAVTPNIDDYSVTSIEATIKQYGKATGYSDMVDFTKPDPHGTELTEMLGENLANTRDAIIRNLVVPNMSNIYFATAAGVATTNAAASTVVGDVDVAVDATMVDKMVLALRNGDADFKKDFVNPSRDYGTTPIGQAYIAVMHPEVGYTVKQFTGFEPVESYAQPGERMMYEVGKYKNVRFLETTHAYTDDDAANSGANTAYYTAFFGEHSFAYTPLAGQEGMIYHQDFGSGEDLLHQRAKLGWKAAWTAAILNDAFCLSLVTMAETDL